MQLSGYLGVFLCFISFWAQAGDEQANQSNAINFQDVASEISLLMQQYHYNPSELKRSDYKKIEKQVAELAAQVSTKKEFIDGFNRLWYEGPFSHVRLAHAHQSAEKTADFLDTMRVGGKGAQLSWENDVAVLTVNTMMGLDTIEQIEAAYIDIQQKKARALIIDLRKNNGGAFAVRPLVGHLLEKPLDVGAFVSQKWSKPSPQRRDILKVEPWGGWSIKAFWHDVQEAPLTRVQFHPVTPLFSGDVYVLTSKDTASAAELAVDALSRLSRVTVIGETTAGQMLSQKMYDLEGGMHIFLPIADYYSLEYGRIEGQGVKPKVEIASQSAMDHVLKLLNLEKEYE